MTAKSTSGVVMEITGDTSDESLYNSFKVTGVSSANNAVVTFTPMVSATWTLGTAYNTADLVKYNDKIYSRIAAGTDTGAETPENTPASWNYVVDYAAPTKGDLVFFMDTGFYALDNNVFIIGEATGTTFEVLGAYLKSTSDVLRTYGTPTARTYKSKGMQKLCLASLSISKQPPNTINIGNFKNPAKAVNGYNVTNGTMTMSGFVDIASDEYDALITAERDNIPRFFLMTLPNNGYVTASITISQIAQEAPIVGVSGYTVSATLNSKAIHCY